MGLLAGLHEPTSGSATIDGMDVTTDMHRIRQSLGVCPQHDVLFEYLTVMEHMEMFASLKGVPKQDIAVSSRNWLARVDLTEKAEAMAETLSVRCQGPTTTGVRTSRPSAS